MSVSLSRREFFSQVPAGAVATLIAAEPPPRAWIILQQGWEHNDEYSYPSGEMTHSMPVELTACTVDGRGSPVDVRRSAS